MFIRKAERKKSKLRLAISGPSGSGKTWSALEIATGMGGKIGMIDTEAGRGELYANSFDYDVIRLEAPYSPQRYIEAIKAFEKEGYDTLIIDSLSHAWSGDGGVLSIVERAGGQFQNGWKTGTPQQNSLVDAIITCKMNLITTMRVKTEYVVEMNEKGKNSPKKVGLAPIQRDQIEYEFTIFMSMNQDHIAHVTKDNTNLFDQQFIKPSKEMGSALTGWLNEGIESVKPKLEIVEEPTDIQQLDKKFSMFMDAIEMADDEKQLKSVFNEIKKINFKARPELFKKLINAKDKRKAALVEASIIKPEEIERNPYNCAGSAVDSGEIGNQ